MRTNERKSRGIRAAIGAAGLVAVLTGVVACAAEDSPAASGLQMVENHGRRVAFHVTPGHDPAIVLDAGGGEDSSYWNKLVPTLAAKTGSTIVTYDRAGMGQSDELPGPWNVTSAVSDLKAGLTQLDITGKVVLVSHSQAGEVATYFTRANPQQVAGAVLVDANIPNFFTATEVTRLEAANRAGIAALKQQPSTKANRQLLATAANFVPAHNAYHQISWPTEVPVTAIVSAKTPFDTPNDAQLWRDAQQEFVQAAPNRHLVTADRSSHDVPKDRPDVVIQAVDQMLATVG